MDFRKVNWWRWQLPELAGKPLPLVYGNVGQPLPPMSDGFVYVQHEGTLEEALDREAMLVELRRINEQLEQLTKQVRLLGRAA